MKSITKNSQSDESIKKVVYGALQQNCKDIKELTDGFFNVAYEVTLTDGREVILKIAPAKSVDVMTYEKGLMHAEVESLRLVHKLSKVPVPEILYYSEDDSTIKNDIKVPFFIMSKIQGITYNHIKDQLSDDEKHQIEYELGQYNRQMNDIIGQNFGYFVAADKHNNNWKQVFLAMVQDVVQDGIVKNADIGMEYDVVLQCVKDNLDALESITVPRLVHWDLWEGNIFVKDGHIEGIIDFERSMWGDPLMEFAFRNLEGNKSFLKGYGNVNLDKEATIRCYLYDIYFYLILTVECSYRLYDEDWQYNWAKECLHQVINKIKNM